MVGKVGGSRMTTTLMVKVSQEFKAAIEEAANRETGGNVSEFIRECIAVEIKYDLYGDEALDGRGRPRTYQTEAERVKARREAERARQQHRKNVVDAVMKQERLDSVDALEKWLIARGISIDDDATDDMPVSRSA